jgi:hypothetical protein
LGFGFSFNALSNRVRIVIMIGDDDGQIVLERKNGGWMGREKIQA